MIDVYKTEEEQIEAIKNWWKQDALKTIGAIVLAAAGYFGWQYWQGQQLVAEQARSDVYQSLLEIDGQLAANSVDTSLKTTFDKLVVELKAEDDGYGTYASMLAAKYAAQSGDLDSAATELEWVLASKPESAISDLASLRLARVYYAAEKYDEALATLVFQDTSAWDVESYELQGDIYTALNQIGQAVVAYEKANTLSEASFSARYIEMKLNKAKAAEAAEQTND